ncbi:hypothetical protein [Streptomyces sp. V4I2]|uniref:hypothetical protein n=1 Tax=Streptomyces sp. V4I2 TaxID=3042280 RepID=UPI002783F97A|nr:hypothetical protein [Streptomyces sp. V4I2]MDQ1046841.1 hypothetical protein [Streptomyces sp. V4I2]
MRPFPDDLAQTQHEWSATHGQLAERPGRTELRRRLYRLSAQLFFPDMRRRDGDVSELLQL